MAILHTAIFDKAYAKATDGIENSAEKNAGIHWGEWVANSIVVARTTDGGGDTVLFAAGKAPGEWQPTEPGLAPALLPQWPKVTCFAMENGAQFRPHKPPTLTSGLPAVK